MIGLPNEKLGHSDTRSLKKREITAMSPCMQKNCRGRDAKNS